MLVAHRRLQNKNMYLTIIIILVLLNMRSIIKLKNDMVRLIAGGWIGGCSTAICKRLTGNVQDDRKTLADTPPQPFENCTLGLITTTPAALIDDPEENDDTRNGRKSAADAAGCSFRYYVGPVLCCTQPMPPPASVIIAANFSYPPPPPPVYYIGPAIFDIMGPPPMACCVAESKFSYPPPPFSIPKRPYPPPPSPPSASGSNSCPAIIRWTDIIPVAV